MQHALPLAPLHLRKSSWAGSAFSATATGFAGGTSMGSGRPRGGGRGGQSDASGSSYGILVIEAPSLPSLATHAYNTSPYAA